MPLPNSLREVSHPQVSRRKVTRQNTLKRSGFVKLPVNLSGGFDHANVRLKSGRVFPVGNRYGKLILHEEIETEKAHSLLPLDHLLQKLYDFLPETDRASVHHEV